LNGRNNRSFATGFIIFRVLTLLKIGGRAEGLEVGLRVDSSVGLRVGMQVGLLVGMGNIPIPPEGLEEVVGLPVGVSVGLLVLL